MPVYEVYDHVKVRIESVRWGWALGVHSAYGRTLKHFHSNHRLSLQNPCDRFMLQLDLWRIGEILDCCNFERGCKKYSENMESPVFPGWPMVWSPNNRFSFHERETWNKAAFGVPPHHPSLSVEFDSKSKAKMAADSVQVGKVDNYCVKCAK